MVFSSMVFLCGFLPVVLTVYALCPVRFRNFFLFIASLFFYAWGEPRYIVIMLFSTVFDYANGIVMEYLDRREKPQYRKWVLMLSVVVNIGILCFFKYTDFVLESVGTLTGHPLPLLKLALPIGISFYTFQTLSYTIDVYRRKVEVQHNIIDFGMYVCLFPQLIAGPIVRYSDVAEQIRNRRGSGEERAYGAQRFIVGLAKKVLLANQIGDLWSQISVLSQSDMSMSAAWLGAIAYTFQIYFDFSGYSDMAIGIALLLGFRFNINFDSPYQSATITEFWRRWHISLSSWLKDYLYISLGGNRKGKIRTYMNLMITMLLGGLWHGASISFILWGALHGIALAAHKFIMGHFSSFKALGCEMKPWRRVLGVLITFHVVCFGWILFRATSMKAVGEMLRQIFTNFHPEVFMQFVLGYKGVFALMVIGYVLHFMPKRSEDALRGVVTRSPLLIQAAILAIAIFIVVQFKSAGVQPFIYFQF